MDEPNLLTNLELPWWRRWPWIAMLGSVPACAVVVGNWFFGSRTWAMIDAGLLAVAWYVFMRLRAAFFMRRRYGRRTPME